MVDAYQAINESFSSTIDLLSFLIDQGAQFLNIVSKSASIEHQSAEEHNFCANCQSVNLSSS